MNSLNFFDLEAIKREWKLSLSEVESKPEALIYSLVWLAETRKNPGTKVADIKGMPFSEVNGYFVAEDNTDVDGETDPGK
jgi:hypothetical protein